MRSLKFQLFLLAALHSMLLSAHAEKFNSIDSAMRKLHIWNLDNLSKTINTKYTVEDERARAIFTWISTHISYDVEGYRNPESLYTSLWPATVKDSIQRETLFNNRVAEKVLKERKAICAGYSRLFWVLCNKAGLPCKIVRGYTRKSTEKKVHDFTVNHDWNLVKINGQWQLMDPTWGAGVVDFTKWEFNFKFRPLYFNTPPSAMIADHYPLRQEDALLPSLPPYSLFLTRPFIYPEFWNFKLQSFNASSGIVNASISHVIDIGIKTTDSISVIQWVQYPSKKSTVFYSDFAGSDVAGNYLKRQDGKWLLHYQAQKGSDNKIVLFINNTAMMEFALEK